MPGITNDKLLIGMKPADFKSIIDVNLIGTFQMTQSCCKENVLSNDQE